MTKQEAITLLKQGKKVAHEFFVYGEWVELKNGKIADEAGCVLDWDLFWQSRKHKRFDKGWREFKTVM